MPRYFTLLALTFTVFSGACSNTPAADPATPPREAAAPGASAAPTDGRAIEITANDTMKFSVTEIKAKPGEALKVTLPAGQHRTPGETPAHRFHEHHVAPPDSTILDRDIECQRDRRR